MNLLCLSDLLDAPALDRLRNGYSALPRVDGRRTAGWAAREAKRNLQLDGGDAGVAALQAELHRHLATHPLLRLYARPLRITPPLFNLYGPGMRYGRHVDDALMGEPPIRTDLAFTVFLSPPESYDGGELVLEGVAGETPIKLGAGAVVVYAAGALHRVEEVTRGERFAAVGWIQSGVRDAAQREILFDLDRARRELHQREGDSEAFATLSRCSGALLRMWAEV